MSLDVYLNEVETCPHCGGELAGFVIYSANITHNLNTMAREAGIYMALWRPEEIGATHASHIIDSLTIGLADMKKRPSYYEQFNSPNGWGLYKNFVPFVEGYLEACREHPNAKITVSR